MSTETDEARSAGRNRAVAAGSGAAAGVCIASKVGAVAVAACSVVGGAVAGRLYDYADKVGEKYGEKAYDWSKEAAGDAWSATGGWVGDKIGIGSLLDGLPCLNPTGCADPSEPSPANFFSDKPEISQLPPVADILKGAPGFPASQSLRDLPRYPSWGQLERTELWEPVASLMRGMMHEWNGYLATPGGVGGLNQQQLQNRFYDVESVVGGVESPNTDPYHPYRFDGGDFGMNAGSVRNALASYVLLGMIADEAAQKRLTSDPSTSDPSTADPSTSDPSTADPSTSDPSTAAPSGGGGAGALLLWGALGLAAYAGVQTLRNKPIVPAFLRGKSR